ncbi:insulinase family protein [Sphingomonas sp. PB2P19]|uniref:M16 family metallopeptidase n=1 Tax=Sphingomonas rhamnosi TaxID=3096156 RepID=UPI002FCBE961
MRFAILPRRANEPGVGVLMRNEGGFIAERRPGERGLAHLIEHIAFVSPTVGAPDDLHHLPHVGLKVTVAGGRPASTSWRESNYYFSTNTTQPYDLDTMLGLLREVATDLTFRPDAVDSQRTDVMREMAEKQLGNRIFAGYIAAVAPGSPNDVIDAQNSDEVPTASIATIRALYRRLYRPENMMIVVVGNVDAERTKAMIEKRFGAWRVSNPVPTLPYVPAFQAERIVPISVSALPQGRRTALITVVLPTPQPPSTRAGQVAAMLMDLVVTRVVNDRLTSTQPGNPAGKRGMFIENGDQGFRQIMLWDNFSIDQWRPAVAGLASLSCELRTAGFSVREWDIARQAVIHDLEHRVNEMPGVANVEIAKDLSHALAAGQNPVLPNTLLEHARSWLPTVSAQTGSDWWQRQWSAGVDHIRVEAPELAPLDQPLAAFRIVADEAVADVQCKVRR